MKRIAITGGIGSGKSTVVKMFNELGIPSLDADEVARQVRDLPSVHAEILKRFGTADRMELRKILTEDAHAKADLEAILLPKILEASERKMKKIEADSHAPFLLYEAILIIEAGRLEEFAGLIVVTATDALKVQRIQLRDHCAPEAAIAMIQAQMSDSERLTYATHTIDNCGTLDQLRKQVQLTFSSLK